MLKSVQNGSLVPFGKKRLKRPRKQGFESGTVAFLVRIRMEKAKASRVQKMRASLLGEGPTKSVALMVSGTEMVISAMRTKEVLVSRRLLFLEDKDAKAGINLSVRSGARRWDQGTIQCE
jgi:hypothetical protein